MKKNKIFIERSKKRRSLWSFGFFCCLLGSLLIGIALAIVITLWLQKVSSNSHSSSISITLTTTSIPCGTSCIGQLRSSSGNRLGRWNFDNNFIDDVTNSVANPVGSPTFTNGYINQAVSFSSSLNQSVNTSIINLANSSFVVDAWIYPTGFVNPLDHTILGLCTILTNYQCLHIIIRSVGVNFFLYFGFYFDDCRSNTLISLNQWIHVAFVFDMTSYTQKIYINGVLDANRTTSGPFRGKPDRATIGALPRMQLIVGPNHFQGLIDRLTITTGEKASCQVLEEATLAAYFNFDTGVQMIDQGPNGLLATGQSLSTTITGRLQQAISFTGATTSYFQVIGLTGLGISNRPFSISIWIRPRRLSGVIAHVSSLASGNGWCSSFLGFSSSGTIVAQMINSLPVSIMSSSIPKISSWTHIVQTWSSTNGLRLYVDNILVANNSAMATSFIGSGISNFVTLGNSLLGTTCIQGGVASLTPFDGDMDEFRIYSRELTTNDVCRLYAIQQ